MSEVYYVDTSALVKLYHQEIGSEQMDALFHRQDTTLVLSEIASVELYSTLARKVRTGDITLEAHEEAARNFEEDCRQRFVVHPLSSAVIRYAKDLLQKHGTIHALRTLDALHVGTCLTYLPGEEVIFVSADIRQLAVALFEGVRVMNPEAPGLPEA